MSRICPRATCLQSRRPSQPTAQHSLAHPLVLMCSPPTHLRRPQNFNDALDWLCQELEIPAELQVQHANFIASAFPCSQSPDVTQHAGSTSGAPAPRLQSQLTSGPATEAKTVRGEAKSTTEDKMADAV